MRRVNALYYIGGDNEIRMKGKGKIADAISHRKLQKSFRWEMVLHDSCRELGLTAEQEDEVETLVIYAYGVVNQGRIVNAIHAIINKETGNGTENT